MVPMRVQSLEVEADHEPPLERGIHAASACLFQHGPNARPLVGGWASPWAKSSGEVLLSASPGDFPVAQFSAENMGLENLGTIPPILGSD